MSPKQSRTSHSSDPSRLSASSSEESILLALPAECLANVFYRFLEDHGDLFERQKALAVLSSTCTLFKSIAETIDPTVLILSGISKVRAILLKPDTDWAQRIQVVAIKTLNHGVKGDDGLAKAQFENPHRLRDVFTLLSSLPKLRRIDLRVNGKRGTIEVNHLMEPLRKLPCLETLESLSIEFPRAYDTNEDGWLVPRRESADFAEIVPRLGALRTLRLTTLGLSRSESSGDSLKLLPPCHLVSLEAADITSTFAAWLSGAADLTIKLAEGCLRSAEAEFRCDAVTSLTLGRIEAGYGTHVSLANALLLKATSSCEFHTNASEAFFRDMPLLQELHLPIAPLRSYSRTRANTRAARTHEEVVRFIETRTPPLALLRISQENWDDENANKLRDACAQTQTILEWT